MPIPLLDMKAQYETVKEEIKKAINDVMETQHFILGPNVLELEERIAAYSQCKYGVGVASGSDALLLALMAINIKPGDEVITTPYTFFATAGAIDRLGAKTVFVDINPQTYNISPSLIERAITPKTKAIIPVHLFGQCADMEPILDIAKKHKLIVIEDAAQAIGATYKEKQAGSMGDFGCFSFFPSKNLGGYGDGGMVVTQNPDYAEKLKVLRTHGSKPKYYHRVVGCNSRLDAIQAAILLVKLKYLNQWHQKRAANAHCYNQLFSKAGLVDRQVILPYTAAGCSHVYNQYVIRAKDRDALQNHLKSSGIGTEVYYPVPLHTQECFRHLGYQAEDCPESSRAALETIAIPVYPELTEEQQQSVVSSITRFYRA